MYCMRAMLCRRHETQLLLCRIGAWLECWTYAVLDGWSINQSILVSSGPVVLGSNHSPGVRFQLESELNSSLSVYYPLPVPLCAYVHVCVHVSIRLYVYMSVYVHICIQHNYMYVHI